jgi:hypothetical protein
MENLFPFIILIILLAIAVLYIIVLKGSNSSLTLSNENLKKANMSLRKLMEEKSDEVDSVQKRLLRITDISDDLNAIDNKFMKKDAKKLLDKLTLELRKP